LQGGGCGLFEGSIPKGALARISSNAAETGIGDIMSTSLESTATPYRIIIRSKIGNSAQWVLSSYPEPGERRPKYQKQENKLRHVTPPPPQIKLFTIDQSINSNINYKPHTNINSSDN
jgi:hypothetical protein